MALRVFAFNALKFCLRKTQTWTKKMRLPERWLDYSPMGEKIPGIPIICFKTPLSQQFGIKHSPVYGLKEQDEFQPYQVCEEVEKKGHTLGLVIDLTNTFRYYDGRQEFEQDQGVEYVKIKFDGYDRTCFNQVFRKFASSIDSFIARCPNSIIGVHCTHGLNRTGYLVCRYMIDVLKYEPQNAIEIFNQARGYSIEKDCFLIDLHKRCPSTKHKKADQPKAETTSASRGFNPGHRREAAEHRSRYCSDDQYFHDASYGKDRSTGHKESWKTRSWNRDTYKQHHRSDLESWHSRRSYQRQNDTWHDDNDGYYNKTGSRNHNW